MYARVWKLTILPEQVEKFILAANDMMPLLRRQPGFRGCLVLRSGPGELEATVVSTWASIDALRESETPLFQQALAGFLSNCERHPFMREEEVVISEFVSKDPDDTVTKF